MSGAHVLNADQVGPLQLPMFMRAHDLVDSLTGTLDSSYDHPDDVMDRKLAKSKEPYEEGSHGSGVYSSVKAEGVKTPVQLVHGEGGSLMMGHGHHRVAAAAGVATESKGHRDMWVPVVHTDAREGSSLPVNAYSSAETKREVGKDYRRWSEDTPAFTADLGWRRK